MISVSTRQSEDFDYPVGVLLPVVCFAMKLLESTERLLQITYSVFHRAGNVAQAAVYLQGASLMLYSMFVNYCKP